MKKQEILETLLSAQERQILKVHQGRWLFAALFELTRGGYKMPHYRLLLLVDKTQVLERTIKVSKLNKVTAKRLEEALDEFQGELGALSVCVIQGQRACWQEDTVAQRQALVEDLARLSQTIWASSQGIESGLDAPQALLF